MEEIIKRGRGRPRKIVSSLEEQENEVIRKYIDSEAMTLEEAALALWMNEGRVRAKPFTKPMVINIERSALEKVKKGLAKYGIKSLDDIFDPKFRKASASNYSTGNEE